MTIIAAATLPRAVSVFRAVSVMPNMAYMKRGRTSAKAMFHGLRMWERKVVNHSRPAPVKGPGMTGLVVRAGVA